MTDSAPEKSTAPVRVFLLDDHEVVRRGVHDLLDAEPDLTVIGEAATAEQAVARVPALRPDVAILDMRLPDGDGVTVCRELRSRMPDLACLMLTSFDDEEALLDSIMAGAAGYVLKQISGTDLVSAVRTVASGQSMLDPGEDGEEPHLPAARQARRGAPGAGRRHRHPDPGRPGPRGRASRALSRSAAARGPSTPPPPTGAARAWGHDTRHRGATGRAAVPAAAGRCLGRPTGPLGRRPARRAGGTFPREGRPLLP